MSRPIIEVRNLSKRYRLGAIGATSFREEFHRYLDRWRGIPHPDGKEFWAVRDVSFDVAEGEIVGVIGRNGAGKSTLLKILSRITEPTSGSAILRGRVASLLEVGTGFHPELTGRENVYLNGAILGMTRAEVARKFDEIVAFAEVEQFIDTPVKRYSSGMYVRLAFAVAAHLEPEILIVDEVLAVGDAKFQQKCLRKMSEVAAQNRTVLFVSHQMSAIENLCQRCLLFRAGSLVAAGPVETVMEEYLAEQAEAPIRRAARDDIATIVHLTAPPSIRSGDRLDVILSVVAARTVRQPVLRLTLYNSAGSAVCSFGNHLTHETLPAADGAVDFRLATGTLPLNNGHYTANVSLSDGDQAAPIDRIEKAFQLTVVGGDPLGTGRLPEVGSVVLPHHWSVAGSPSTDRSTTTAI